MKAIPFSLSQLYARSVVVLSVTIVMSMCLYGILLLLTVMHAAARQSAQTNINALATQVGVLETDYLQKTETITPATVAQLGLVKPATVSTVYADAGSLSLRMVQ